MAADVWMTFGWPPTSLVTNTTLAGGIVTERMLSMGPKTCYWRTEVTSGKTERDCHKPSMLIAQIHRVAQHSFERWRERKYIHTWRLRARPFGVERFGVHNVHEKGVGTNRRDRRKHPRPHERNSAKLGSRELSRTTRSQRNIQHFLLNTCTQPPSSGRLRRLSQQVSSSLRRSPCNLPLRIGSLPSTSFQQLTPP